jgi:hypothetical protein
VYSEEILIIRTTDTLLLACLGAFLHILKISIVSLAINIDDQVIPRFEIREWKNLR